MQVREIMGLKVMNILTADTFEVFPPWRWEDQSGIKVTIAGLGVPLEGEVGYDNAKNKLKSLIQDKEVELRNKKEVDYDRLVCDVYFNGKNLVDYFPEYKE